MMGQRQEVWCRGAKTAIPLLIAALLALWLRACTTPTPTPALEEEVQTRVAATLTALATGAAASPTAALPPATTTATGTPTPVPPTATLTLSAPPATVTQTTAPPSLTPTATALPATATHTASPLATVLPTQTHTSQPTRTGTPSPSPTYSPTPVITEWRGEYYANSELRGAPRLVRNDSVVTFDWGGGAPAPGFPADAWSARWSRTLHFEGGTYQFLASVDDGIRVWVDDMLIIDSWQDGSLRTVSHALPLVRGNHRLRIEYLERAGEAVMRFWWERIESFSDWKGEYWPNRDLDGAPALVRNDLRVDYDWGEGAAAPGLPRDDWSARWSRIVEFDAALYRFYVLVDDGARLWVDGVLLLDEWRESSSRTVSALLSLAPGRHSVRLEYFERGGSARVRLWWEREGSFPDWRGEYWANRHLAGSPALARNDPAIDFTWGEGSPDGSLPADEFSARWTRRLHLEGGLYRFRLLADDGARVWVDGELVLDTWSHYSPNEISADRDLGTGQHDLRVEYFEGGGNARMRFRWERVDDAYYPDWKGEYWPNQDLLGPPALTRNDGAIAFDWGRSSPAPGLPEDGFSARWSRTVALPDGVYRFHVRADDGVRFYLNGELLIDEWHDGTGQEYVVERGLTGVQEWVVEHYDRVFEASIQFGWTRLSSSPGPL